MWCLFVIYVPGNGHQAGEGVEVVGVPHGDREEALDDSSRLEFKRKFFFTYYIPPYPQY